MSKIKDDLGLKNICSIISLIALSLYVNIVYGNENTYSNEALGVVITKPSDWHFISTSVVEEHRDNVQFNDDSLMQQIKDKVRLPIVTIAKYHDPLSRESVTPTVQVVVSVIDEAVPLEKIIFSAAAAIKQSAHSFKVIKETSSLLISGLSAASAEFELSVLNQANESFNLSSKLNVVRRG